MRSPSQVETLSPSNTSSHPLPHPLPPLFSVSVGLTPPGPCCEQTPTGCILWRPGCSTQHSVLRGHPGCSTGAKAKAHTPTGQGWVVGGRTGVPWGRASLDWRTEKPGAGGGGGGPMSRPPGQGPHFHPSSSPRQLEVLPWLCNLTVTSGHPAPPATGSSLRPPPGAAGPGGASGLSASPNLARAASAV